MNYDSFKQKREEIIAELEEIRKSLTGEKCIENVDKCIAQLKEGRFRISVIGNFSNGKSTFLNALMGFDKEILVVDGIASTAAITAIQEPIDESLINRACITFNDSERAPEYISIEEIGNYTVKQRDEKGNVVNDRVEDEVKEVRLFLGSRFLKNGVEIIDTPGLNSAYEKHTDITEGIIQKSDAAVFMFSIDQAGAGNEFQIMNLLGRYIEKAFLVVNKIDLKFNSKNCDMAIDDVCEDLEKKLDREEIKLGGRQIFPVSAKYAFDANCADEDRKKNELMELSRFTDFTAALESYLCSEKFEEQKLRSPLKKLKTAVSELRSANESQIDVAKNDIDIINDTLSKIEERIKEEKEIQRSKQAEIRRNVDNVFESEHYKLEIKCDEICDEIKADIERHNTEYSIIHHQKTDDDHVEEAYKRLISCWQRMTNNIMSEISQIVEESFIGNEQFDNAEIGNKLSEIARVSLDFKNVYEKTEFRIDFSDIEKKENDLSAKKAELENITSKILRLKSDSVRLKDCRARLEAIRDEEKRLREDIYDLYKAKADVVDGERREIVYEDRDRKGVLGKIGEFFIGKKTVKTERIVVDKTISDNMRKQYGEAIEMHQSQLDKAEQEAENIKDEAYKLSAAEDELGNAYEDKEDLRNKIRSDRNKLDDERDEVEEFQIKAYQEKKKRQVKDITEDFQSETKKVLRQISENMKRFIDWVIAENNNTLKQLEEEKNSCVILKTSTDEERSALIAEKEKENESVHRLLSFINNYMKTEE